MPGHLESQAESVIASCRQDYHGLSKVAIANVMEELLSSYDRRGKHIELLKTRNTHLQQQLIDEQEARADAEQRMAQMRRDLLADSEGG